ncbi:hypothetical protein [Planococcus lenghuensis]|uniref:Uncharacterized protein n=1 Tax=Planococcus lenghuensis TaxID=2213202 RepID=A0A1Q2KY31_9BACL|nr:hypothetical protein [Planococcus lenghuensis]AQQ53111.1 hypothetical protein B0X71_08390 [Planococcus lenghuensis]
MSTIKKMANRLVIEQDLNAVCISRSSNGCLEIIEHCVAEEAEASASFFIFSAEEKQALLEYLLEDALTTAVKSDRNIKRRAQPQS